MCSDIWCARRLCVIVHCDIAQHHCIGSSHQLFMQIQMWLFDREDQLLQSFRLALTAIFKGTMMMTILHLRPHIPIPTPPPLSLMFSFRHHMTTKPVSVFPSGLHNLHVPLSLVVRLHDIGARHYWCSSSVFQGNRPNRLCVCVCP